MELDFATISNKLAGDTLVLKCFTTSRVVPTCYIKISILEAMLKYNIMSLELQVLDAATKEFTSGYTLESLLAECAEVKEFARLYFPEYAI